MKVKTKAWKKYTKETLLVVGIGFLAFLLTGATLHFLFKLTLKFYQETVQVQLFPTALALSFFFLIYCCLKRKWIRALLLFLFPILIYDLINFTTETILYASEMTEALEEMSLVEAKLTNINVSLGDLKIILTTIAIILWCWVWLKVKGE